jgi:hypothetical protein
LTLADGSVISPPPVGLQTASGVNAQNTSIVSTRVNVLAWSAQASGQVSNVFPVGSPLYDTAPIFSQSDCQRVNYPMSGTNCNGYAVPCGKSYGGCVARGCVGLTWRN